MKEKTHILSVVMIFAFLGIAAACNLPQSAATPDLGLIVAQTQTAMAVELYLTSTVVPAMTTPPIEIPTSLPETSIVPTSSQNPLETSVTSTPLLPTAVPVQSNCTNSAKFESETIPDNTSFGVGQEFIKNWVLRNTGTCTWTADYVLVHVRGDTMGGSSPVPIGQNVPPGSNLMLYLPQKAPQATGEYQGFWKLRTPAGQEFGLGQNADVAFWVKIKVVPNGSAGSSVFSGPQNLGAPSWSESFDGKRSPFFLGTDSGIDYDLVDGYLAMTALKPTGDQWRVYQQGYLEDAYLQAKFLTGAVCNGKDGYGLIVRAPDRPDGNINSGYVFSFSCDGKYRLYRMDNGNYTNIQNWTNSPVIKAGANQTNVLGVYAHKNQLQLYANGALIYEVSDNAYAGGLFGLVLRAESTQNYQVFVDEIAYWIIR